jgi:asparagine N-glycosylation enzyme membrane subunit Stt3
LLILPDEHRVFERGFRKRLAARLCSVRLIKRTFQAMPLETRTSPTGVSAERASSVSGARTAAALMAVCTVALVLRVVPPYRQVFRGDRVVFSGNDPWIHMRDADNIAAHWPLASWFDPYRLAPEGEWTEAPLMDIAVAGIARVTTIPLDVVGAWLPAICGALIPIPLFFLTRRLFGVAEAVIASLLIAVLPGSLLQRSLLGQTDHHVVEALLAVIVLLFLVRAIELQSNRDAAIAGIVLGLYLLTWARGAFLVLILIAWALVVISSRADGAKSPASSRSEFFAPLVITFAIALVIAAPVAIHFPPMGLTIPTLAGGALVVTLAERLPRRAAIALIIIACVAALFALPDLLTQLRRFLPTGGAATVGEVQPLLSVNGHFSLRPLWLELTTASALALIGFVIAVRDRAPSKMLLLVWSVVVTAATLAQVRFAYYMAVAAAILAAVGAVRFLWHGVNRVFGVIAIAAIVIYPNVPLAMLTAATPVAGPTDGWLQALDWIRTHTPEPFGSSNAYFARYASKRDAPVAKYGVMVWSDYGWWVARIARRPPSTNPTQVAVKEAARFYLATTEAEALRILGERKARYAIADRSMPMTIAGAGQMMSSQLEPMARWAEESPSRFYELAWNHGRPLFIYYPDYYRTMAVRLFGYDGKAFTPKGTSWAIELDANKQVVDSRRFQTWEAAAAFVASDPAHWRLAGLDPLVSCVPLEPLGHFSQVWVAPKHDVKVFEVRPTV